MDIKAGGVGVQKRKERKASDHLCCARAGGWQSPFPL